MTKQIQKFVLWLATTLLIISILLVLIQTSYFCGKAEGYEQARREMRCS